MNAGKVMVVAAGVAVTLGIGAVMAAAAWDGLQEATTRLVRESGLKPPTIVIGGGAVLDIGEGAFVRASVFGKDPCPRNEGIMAVLFGGGDERFNCIALDKPEVDVSFVVPSEGLHLVHEKWTVHREGDRIWLTRPNGLLVSEPK